MTIKPYSSFFVMALALMTLTACNKAEVEPVDLETEETPVAMESIESESTEVDSSNEESEIPVGSWTLDVNKSIVTWTGNKMVGSSHTGTVGVKAGDLVVNAQGPTSGEFVMDMTTITENTNNEDFLTHIKGDDFFSVEKHPEAKFVITDIASSGTDQYEVKGDLTIRGITKPITFEATAQYDETEKTLVVKTDFQIDRTEWNINFNSSSFVQNLGDNAIKDEIDFQLDLGFYLEAA